MSDKLRQKFEEWAREILIKQDYAVKCAVSEDEAFEDVYEAEMGLLGAFAERLRPLIEAAVIYYTEGDNHQLYAALRDLGVLDDV